MQLRLTKLEDVKLKSLEAVFVKFDAQQVGSDEAELDGVGQAYDESEMVEIGLSSHQGPSAGSTQMSLSTSMFSPGMSQFYSHAKSFISQSSMPS